MTDTVTISGRRLAIPMVSPPPERRRQLLLEQLLDERAHLAAHRLLQRIEPIAPGKR